MLSTGDSFSLVFPHTEQDRRKVLKSGRGHSALSRDLYTVISEIWLTMVKNDTK